MLILFLFSSVYTRYITFNLSICIVLLIYAYLGFHSHLGP